MLITSKDLIEPFIPAKKPDFIILGTMAAICARHIDGEKSPVNPFFYHNNVNRFWNILRLLKGHEAPLREVREKRQFLERHRIAISNTVGEIRIAKKDKDDASDLILFAAQKENRLKAKVIGPRFRALLSDNDIPIYFTCRHKAPLQKLLELFFATNELDFPPEGRIHYLASPTRQGAERRSKEWRTEMAAHQANYGV